MVNKSLVSFSAGAVTGQAHNPQTNSTIVDIVVCRVGQEEVALLDMKWSDFHDLHDVVNALYNEKYGA